MAEELIFKQYVSRFQGIEVYQNRVVISTGTFAKTEKTILAKSITGVALNGPAKFLIITDQAGNQYKEKFLAGKIAEGAQRAILETLK